MKIFANENLFEPIIDYLKSLRYDVVSIRDAKLSGITSVVIPDLIRNPEFSMKHLDSRFCGNDKNSKK